jgi:hypothetical protein
MEHHTGYSLDSRLLTQPRNPHFSSYICKYAPLVKCILAVCRYFALKGSVRSKSVSQQLQLVCVSNCLACSDVEFCLSVRVWLLLRKPLYLQLPNLQWALCVLSLCCTLDATEKGNCSRICTLGWLEKDVQFKLIPHTDAGYIHTFARSGRKIGTS